MTTEQSFVCVYGGGGGGWSIPIYNSHDVTQACYRQAFLIHVGCHSNLTTWLLCTFV